MARIESSHLHEFEHELKHNEEEVERYRAHLQNYRMKMEEQTAEYAEENVS